MPPDFRNNAEWIGKDKKMRKLFILASLLLLFAEVRAQVISGRITDEQNKALVFCDVIVLNNNIGTATNENGEFKLQNIPEGNYKIQFSFIGYKTKTEQFTIKKGETKHINLKLESSIFQSDATVITATKTILPINKIPASIVYISPKELSVIPAQNIDETMKYSSGIIINRPFGIFGKSVVGIRGVVSNEPGRQLTLIDGVPINKSDGGAVNWNRIINLDIEHIEIQKGPSSSIYGNNAMGGIVNLITKRPYKKGISGVAKTYYGTYNTFGGSFNFMQKFSDNIKGAYYSVSAKALQSDGYITVPDSIRDSTDIATFVKEYAVNSRIGYRYSYNTNVEIEYNYYNDRRGQGIKIRQDEGMTADHDTHFFKTRFKTKTAFINWDINMYYQIEKYLKTIEKLKKANYSLINVNSNRIDYGLIIGGNTRYKNNVFTYGLDYNNGSVDAADEYQTSTDKVVNKGVMETYNVYLQDEISLFTEKIKTILSLNYAFANFHSGLFNVENPTSNTDFMLPYSQQLDNKIWSGFSPKIAMQYNFNEFSNTYISLSNGFRTANLDDMTRTGFINIGYKIANPNLKPETIDNYELGYRYNKKKIAFNFGSYYSRGHNFMYYLSTGDALFGGKKKIYKKENISEVEIYGLEIGIKYYLIKSLNFSVNYTYNQSTIKKFKGNDNLIGKTLTYSPLDVVNIGAIYNKKKIGACLFMNYKGRQFITEDNLSDIPNITTFDANITYKFYKNIGFGIKLQNILDKTYMVNSNQVSLGRFISFEFNYKFWYILKYYIK